tara:strand:+ start:14697 stop:15215 length:519 start_codon:yes stop_codon:yes gene_type:complete
MNINKNVKEKIKKIKSCTKRNCKISNETTESIIEETSGAMTSHGILTILAMTAGGLALITDPLTGTIIVAVSVVYGSIIKVKTGKLFSKKKPLQINSENLEENMVEVLKSINLNSPKYLKSKTSKYAFIRIPTFDSPKATCIKVLKEANNIIKPSVIVKLKNLNKKGKIIPE